MDLTPEQKDAVASWVREGKPLADIQRGLEQQYDLKLTYMDVRFLVDDLDVEMPRDPDPDPEPPADTIAPDPSGDEAPVIEGEFSGGGLKVDVDSVTRPGAVVSGEVTFSDGVTAKWSIDQMGRLGLDPSQPGYRPSPEDIQAFQSELQTALQSKGL
jgi:hypothetical protein